MINNWLQTFDIKRKRTLYVKPTSIEVVIPIGESSVVLLSDNLDFVVASNNQTIIGVSGGIDSFIQAIEVDLSQVVFIRKKAIRMFMPISNYTRIKTVGGHALTLNLHPVDLILLSKCNIVATPSIKSITSWHLRCTGMEK